MKITKVQNLDDKIIAQGVANLKEFGYPDCNAENILTDRIYSAFFKSILEDNLGKGYDGHINGLLAKIEANSVQKP